MDRYNLLKTKFDKKEKIVGTTMTMIAHFGKNGRQRGYRLYIV